MIDDDSMLLKLYEMTARTHEDIILLTATNTVDGDEIVHSQKPDVILLDLILGKEPNTPITEVDKNHGFNFLIVLKGDPRTQDIPVLILSNLDTKQDHDRAKSLPAEECTVKAQTTPGEVFERAKGAADIAGARRRIREV